MTGDVAGSIRPFYADWAGYNRRAADGLEALAEGDLALRPPDSDHWPIWAIAAHMAGTRIFWLCEIFGEPGLARMPFYEAGGMGWEDHPETPRSGAEVAGALRSSWSVVDGCLATWTPAMLEDPFERQGSGGLQVHTRQSILLRLITHEAYHLGEINIALGSNGRTPIDPWPGSDWSPEAPRSTREGS
ncbi:MAG: DinB family protein [Candidatus Limnocylindrales bacterium]